MTRDAALTTGRTAAPSGLRVGERLRQLRVASGLTQSELAGERFSKEYVSQIERGKTRPTRETVEWLAARLGVDPGFLANGVATDERGRLEGALARAEALIEGLHNDEASAEYESLVPAARATGVPELAVRALVGAGRTQMRLGALNLLLGMPDEAISLLKEAFCIDLETGRDADAGRAVSSLAQIHLRTGNVEQAEEQARHAIKLLNAAGYEDYVDEVGSSHLVLGRALLEQSRLDEAEEAFVAAESAFDQLGSASHRASAWVARGDLAARRGDDRLSAHLYRTAAEALQDLRF